MRSFMTFWPQYCTLQQFSTDISVVTKANALEFVRLALVQLLAGLSELLQNFKAMTIVWTVGGAGYPSCLQMAFNFALCIKHSRLSLLVALKILLSPISCILQRSKCIWESVGGVHR